MKILRQQLRQHQQQKREAVQVEVVESAEETPSEREKRLRQESANRRKYVIVIFRSRALARMSFFSFIDRNLL